MADAVRTALAFGSNVGETADNIRQAIDALAAEDGLTLVRESALYRTPPWGLTDQDWFCNACALFDTELSPRALLDVCQDVERNLGRVRTVRWGPRLIDIDIITFGSISVSSDALTIPHPHAHERGFVLVPLNEIAPDLALASGTVRDNLAGADTQGIVRLASE
ncbi:MAG: 2-amino-4-hydroxy-6-hydroxymethyldihydropteridine diphosphokinase [Pseudomonadota bacterium]